MTFATKYNPSVSWRTLSANVYQLIRETVEEAATYRVTVKAIDTNNPGAGQKEIGYYLVDYIGTPYLIIGTGSTTIDVQDIFRTGFCPTSGQMSIVYKSVYNGRALCLAPDNFRHLHPLALLNSHRFDMAVLWANDPNAKKVPFTASALPTINNYQTDQEDPEDPTKTINYAEDFSEDPQVRCIITVDGSIRFQRQQMPFFTYVDDLIDTIYFDLGEELSGYMLISKS
jgi:hypothetical protein